MYLFLFSLFCWHYFVDEVSWSAPASLLFSFLEERGNFPTAGVQIPDKNLLQKKWNKMFLSLKKAFPRFFWWGADLLEELVQFHSCILSLHLIQNVFLLATWSRILSQHCKRKTHSGLGISWQYAFIKSLKCKCMEKRVSYPITELHCH